LTVSIVSRREKLTTLAKLWPGPGAAAVCVYGDDKDLAKGVRKPLPKDANITLTRKTDPEGKCSKFVAESDVFTKEMKLAGSLSAKVGDEPCTGEFKQE
jgi:hypothetical protein